MHRTSPSRQRGAVIVTVCLVLLFLLGFMGIALDFGRAFIVRSELQSAVDSCALGAAQELDGATDAITRAVSAGLTAGNANRVYFQSPTWGGAGQLTQSDLVFRDASFVQTTVPAQARYAECRHSQANGQPWLLQALAAFNNDPSLSGPQSVLARAVATRASAQTTCPIPVALKPKTSSSGPPNYGYAVGEWVTMLTTQSGSIQPGYIGWANLDGSNSASETVAEMNGRCGVRVGDTVGTPGTQSTVVDNWNYRFGIYKNSGDPSVTIERPDFTGYAYTSKNWPSGFNAFDGATPVGADSTAANYATKRTTWASCADTGTQVRGGSRSCEGITGLSLNSFQKQATPGNTSGGFRQYGVSRRLVLAPVVNNQNKIVDYACMFMLQPLSLPMANTQLEFRGNAGAVGSPCTTNGLAGGSAGPLVPVLVR